MGSSMHGTHAGIASMGRGLGPFLLTLALAAVPFGAPLGAQAVPSPARPFGTLREQAARQQRWLRERMDSVLPALMRRDSVDMWVVPMREYAEDPVFPALVAPTTFSARRRTIYLFYDRGPARGVERIAFGGSSQGGVYDAVRATTPVANGIGGARAELWGDQQWAVLREAIAARRPRTIAVDVDRTTAFADGLSAGEYAALQEALGPEWRARLRPAGALAVDFLATRVPDEERFYGELTRLTWALIDTMFSRAVVRPDTTRTSELVWWWRQRVNDLGLATWFQPSIEVQRRGASDASLGDDPVIRPGDVLHCDVGVTALGLNTDVQHMAYVLRPGETAPPLGLVRALRRSNRLQEIVMAELRPGRTGNEILGAARARMQAEGLDGSVYSHPIGLYGHGPGPLIGLWDYQDGVPGRGDERVIPRSWYSIELQVTTPVPEWGGQPVRSMQEEDMVMGADGVPRWAWRRQTEWRVIR